MLPPDADSGLICGFHAPHGGGGMAPIFARDVDAVLASRPKAMWLHFNLADQRSRHFIATCPMIPEAARGFLAGREDHTKFETLEGGLCGALLDLRMGADSDADETGTVRFWCNDFLMVSADRTALQTMDDLRQIMTANAIMADAFDIVLALFNQLAANCGKRIAEFQLRLDRIEDAILGEHFGAQASELGRLRRGLVRLRRLVGPQRHELKTLASRPPALASEDARDRLRDVADRLAARMVELEQMQESAWLLQEEQAIRQTEVTNRNLYFISLATAIFLPMTLVTGIFGMNVAGLPGLEGEGSFWLVMIAMLAIGVGAVFLLRLRRLL